MIAAANNELADLSVEAQAFYRKAIHVLHGANVPFMMGGAYALAQYTGVIRHTKDFDIFVRPPTPGARSMPLPAPGFTPS